MKSELHKKIREENYAIRFLVYIVGLFIMTLGISLSVKSNLGVSPVSSIPYTITCITGLEMGKATILFHIVLVVMQILILRKAFQMKNLLQVVVGVIFGYFTTFSNYLFSFLPTPEHMTVRLLMMLGSTVLIAVGEGAMKAVSDTTHIAFNKVKVGFDISMVIISLISCLVALGTLGSVGVGTIIAAVLVGSVLGVITGWFGEKRDKILKGTPSE